MSRLIGRENINDIRTQLKLNLEKIRQNYIPGAIIVPNGIELNGFVTVNMKVTADDIRYFTLAIHICDTIERILYGEYDTKTILYLLDAESDLSYFLKSTFKTQQPAPGVEIPDYYFLKTTHLMCSFIRDNLNITVNPVK